jgi:hypothetical protein
MICPALDGSGRTEEIKITRVFSILSSAISKPVLRLWQSRWQEGPLAKRVGVVFL